MTAVCLSTASLLLELLVVKLGYFFWTHVCLRMKLRTSFTFYVPVNFIWHLTVFDFIFLVLTSENTSCTIYIIIIMIIKNNNNNNNLLACLLAYLLTYLLTYLFHWLWACSKLSTVSFVNLLTVIETNSRLIWTAVFILSVCHNLSWLLI